MMESPLGDLVDYLVISAACFPRRSALVHQNHCVSYADLLAESQSLADVFKASGLKGKLVGIMAPAIPETVYVYYACFISGAVLVPINYSFRFKELRTLLENCPIRVLFYHEDHECELQRVGKPFDQIPIKIRINRTASESASIKEAFNNPEQQSANPSHAARSNQDEPAVIFHTSGTTGKPKGAFHSRHSASYFARCYLQLAVDEKEPRTLIARNCYHSGGFFHLTGALASGATCFLNDSPNGFDAEAFVRQLEEYEITQVFLSVSMLNAILASKSVSEASFRSSRFVSVGADEVKPYHYSELRKYTQLPLSVRYSSTEATCISIEKCQSGERDVISVGTPQTHFDWKIELTDPEESVGELLLKGPAVFSGYNNNPEESKNCFTEDGWYRTRDLFRVNKSNQLIFCGRNRNTIKVGGKIVYPNEIEAAVNAHRNVRDSVAVAVPHLIEVQVPFLFVQPLNGAMICEQELLEFLSDCLAIYKVPAGIRIVDSFPLTQGEKIDRQQLVGMARHLCSGDANA